MRYVQIFLVTSAIIFSSVAHAQEKLTLDDAKRLLQVAEQSARQARESAASAQAASERADKQLQEVKKVLAELQGQPTPAPPAPVRVAAAPAPAIPVPVGCPAKPIDSLDYFKSVSDCEKSILENAELNDFKARATTGMGTTLSAASSGTTATFSLKRVSNYRWLSNRDFGPFDNILQQRVSRRTYEIGIRADLNKDDKNGATIATLGQLDKLSSNLAIFAEYGRDYSVSEPFARTAKTSKWSFVHERANTLIANLTVKCRAAGWADCSDIGLVQWIFQTKDKGFVNPEAVKAYNAVFWGPPTVDTPPRFGWSVRGEIARPTYDYFPFVLTKVADPFNSGKMKTIIDPTAFPQDFGSRITKDDAVVNWALTARGFFHLSTRRAKNYADNNGLADLRPFLNRESGTTFVASVSYVRKSEIQKPFRDNKICPAATGAQYVSDQLCTTVNIAAPSTKDSVVLGGEIRQGFEPFWVLPPILTSIKYTHDFTSEENGLVIPFLFAEDEKGIFKSGLQFGHKWGGKNDDGSIKPAESVFGVVLGLSLGLDGTKQ